jgi:GntR family transcriptional regulator
VQFFVNTADELPLYRQLVRQIIEAIAGGRLKSGEQLQSHRELSEQLVIAPLTVKRAYDELESLGYIETQRGRGTFVRATLPAVNLANQREDIEKAARRLLSQAYLAGMDLADVMKLLEALNREMTDREMRNKERE